MFKLKRTLPDGTVKEHSQSFALKRQAAQAAFYVLYYNVPLIRRVEAAKFANSLQAAATGIELKHESGYAFTIVEE